MPASYLASTPSSAASTGAFSAALKASTASSNATSSRWLRLAVRVSLLAIAVQLVVMAQLAQHQVQRGVQLRQAIAVERQNSEALFRPEPQLYPDTVSADDGQQAGDARLMMAEVSR